MKLVGGQQLDCALGDHSLVANLFGRLRTELRDTGDVLRYVGYESRSENGNNARFLGVEVNSFDRIPQDMIAWELTDTDWIIRCPTQARFSAEWQEEIRWQWRDAQHGRTTGEFCAQGPPDWGRSGVDREVLMFSNAYFAADGSDPQDNVELVDYDSSWPEQYNDMAAWLRRELGPGIALKVEHYGSTAIPGMPAKPVIDILVEIPSFHEARKRAIPLLNNPLW
jgi:hypothetical protein